MEDSQEVKKTQKITFCDRVKKRGLSGDPGASLLLGWAKTKSGNTNRNTQFYKSFIFNNLQTLWRSGADSNRRTRFCRPLPSHSATRPYDLGAQIYGIIFNRARIFLRAFAQPITVRQASYKSCRVGMHFLQGFCRLGPLPNKLFVNQFYFKVI